MTAPALSRRRRLIYRLICLSLPILVLVLLEGGLRLFGWGGYPDFFRELPLSDSTTLVVSDKAGSSRYFFANRERPGTNDEFGFVMPKPAGTVRIFLCGASAIKGFPEPQGFTAGAFLQDLLQRLWPDRKVEVVNLGTTAVASFPVLDIVREAVQYEPDLLILYTGNNEFFGAYGVASVNRGIAAPALLAAQYQVRRLAVVQAAQQVFGNSIDLEGRTLMEAMIGSVSIPSDSPLRTGAARLLESHVSGVAEACRSAGVPLLVCLPAANERGLAPLGKPDETRWSKSQRDAISSRIAVAQKQLVEDPGAARALLKEVVEQSPTHARAHFLLARCEEAIGDADEALSHYRAAIDNDTMPWRPTSQSVEAIRSTAEAHETPICDVPVLLRERDSAAGIGWEMMDDHVHFSLLGQQELARILATALAQFPPPLRVDPVELARVADYEEQRVRLGHNPYDALGVATQMRKIFEIPFMRESNPEATQLWAERVEQAERLMSPELREVARRWRQRRTHAGAMRPMSGMVARVLVRQQRYDEAAGLFRAARASVPEYSSWHMEYSYFELICSKELRETGGLSPAGREQARAEIARGEVLLSFGQQRGGMAERHMGRLYQLLDEHDRAIPYLEAARQKLTEIERVAADQALIFSYLKTEKLQQARQIAEDGVAHSGEFRQHYQKMLESLPEL